MAVKMVLVKSSNIKALGYDPVSKELHVEFKSGDVYAYSGVDPKAYQALMAAPSIGSHLAKNVKSKFQVRKVIK